MIISRAALTAARAESWAGKMVWASAKEHSIFPAPYAGGGRTVAARRAGPAAEEGKAAVWLDVRLRET